MNQTLTKFCAAAVTGVSHTTFNLQGSLELKTNLFGLLGSLGISQLGKLLSSDDNAETIDLNQLTDSEIRTSLNVAIFLNKQKKNARS